MSHVPAADDPVEVALTAMRRATPARLFVGRAGTSYRTSTLLGLRADHAVARDAVRAALDLDDPRLASLLVDLHDALVVQSRAQTIDEHLVRPDLGRLLDDEGAARLSHGCPKRPGVQIVIGDGLSAHAVAEQVPLVLPPLLAGLTRRGIPSGRLVVVRHCRVGVMNDIGRILEPELIVLLIGERPGLTQARSLSAYLAWRPRPGCTDAERNVVSNIHAAGSPPEVAVPRVLDLIDAMRAQRVGGVALGHPPHAGPLTSGGR